MSKRMGLPVTLKMRHDAHYVEQLTSFSGAAVGRMIPVDKIRPNPDQPRKALGELRELTDSIKEKGVLEPLLVRFMPRDDCYHIISGERRYHASRAAGLREVPCIEKIADDAETLELALIENLQRKDLTPFEEADGLQRLAETFEYTHDDIAKKIAKARSSVTETMSLRVIPEVVRKRCLELGVVSKSVLLQVARQPNERKMLESVHRIAQGGLTRDERDGCRNDVESGIASSRRCDPQRNRDQHRHDDREAEQFHRHRHLVRHGSRLVSQQPNHARHQRRPGAHQRDGIGALTYRRDDLRLWHRRRAVAPHHNRRQRCLEEH